MNSFNTLSRLLALVAIALLTAHHALSQPAVADEVLIAWQNDLALAHSNARTLARHRLQARGFTCLREASHPDRPETWRVPRGMTVGAAMAELRRDPAVRIVERNLIRQLAETIPNDPLFLDNAWPLRNPGGTIDLAGDTGPIPAIADADIDATDVWDITTGSASVVVAMIDTGIDLDHPDLADNLWINTGEIPNNATDDDENGYIDDVNGWDFVDNDAVPNATSKHGVFVSGIIGMVGNNGVGSSGVCWDVSLMTLRVFDGATLDNLIAAIDYAADNGADVINASYGGYGYSELEREAIARAGSAEVIFVAATGNDALLIDHWRFYPAVYELPNLISVGATSQLDGRATFSNWGGNSMDLLAPGIPIFSTQIYPVTTPNNTPPGFDVWAGTSFAAPHASGAAALYRSEHPNASAREVTDRMRGGVDRLLALTDLARTEGRLNAMGMWSDDTVSPEAITDLTVGQINTFGATLHFTAPGEDGFSGTPARWDVRVSPSPITEESWDTATRAWDIPFPWVQGFNVSVPIMRVSNGVLRPDTAYHIGMRAIDEAGNRGPISNPVQFTTSGVTTIFFDDFETDTGVWSADASWERTDEEFAFSGTFTYHDSVGLPYLPNSDIALTLNTPLSLPNSPEVELDFVTMWDFPKEQLQIRDGGVVEVSTDGASWEIAQRFHSTSQTYQRFRIPLGRWQGEDVQLRWRLFSNATTQLDGWWIDDVHVFVPDAPQTWTPDIIVESDGAGRTDPLLGTFVDAVSGETNWTNAVAKSGLAVLDAAEVREIDIDTPVEAWAHFRPWLPNGGEFELAITWPTRANAANVTVTIAHADGEDSVALDQSTSNANRWIDLGRYRFEQGLGAEVTIDTSSVTGPAVSGENGLVVADAVRWRQVPEQIVTGLSIR